MEKEVLPHFIEHFNRFVRQGVSPEKKVLLCVDEHSSRLGRQWIELCRVKT